MRFFQHDEIAPNEYFNELLSAFLASVMSNQALPKSDTHLLDEFLENTALRRKGFPGTIKADHIQLGSIGQKRKSQFVKFVQKHFCRCWKDRHLIIGDEGIGYSHKISDSSVSDSFYFDSTLSIEHGPSATPEGLVLRIKTSAHKIKVRCRSHFQKYSWLQAVVKAVQANKYCKINRFLSFAPPCTANACKAYTSAENYFRDVCEALEGARKSIFITDWWLSPEVHLIRPVPRFADGSFDVTWRLDTVLLRAAQRGCRVCILLFKEVQRFMTNSSLHAQTTLNDLHPNIEVLRHPGEIFWFWSHHEKMCVVDQTTAFMGGIDLCFGRFDTDDYILREPGDMQTHVYFPGQDYSNVRIKDFVRVEEHELTLIDRNVLPRMPWRDIAIQLRGEIVGDVVRHFKQYWNFARYDLSIAKKNTNVTTNQRSDEEEFANGGIPSQIHFERELPQRIPNNPRLNTYQNGHDQMTNYTGYTMNGYENRRPYSNGEVMEAPSDTPKYSAALKKPIRLPINLEALKVGVQPVDPISNLFFQGFPEKDDHSSTTQPSQVQTEKVTSQASGWGFLKRNKKFEFPAQPASAAGSQNNYPQQYPEQQAFGQADQQPEPRLAGYLGSFFKGRNKSSQSDKHVAQQNYPKKSAPKQRRPEDRGFLSPHQEQDLMNTTSQWIGDFINKTSGEYTSTCQLLRSGSAWSIGLQSEKGEHSIHNAYQQLISEAQHFIYIENQFFISSVAGEPVCNKVVETLANRILKAAKEKKPFRVVVVLPLLPGFEGDILDDKASVLRIQLGWELATISQGADSLFSK